MKKSFRTFLTLLLLIMGTTMSWADDGVLATWDFTNSSCAAGNADFQGNTGTVNSDVEGIALYVDATAGKFNSAKRSSDIQINATTIIQIPVKAKGDVITITNYGGDYGIGYTIGAEEVAKTVDSYTYTANSSEAKEGHVTMTVTTDGYARKITVLQHEPKQEGGKTYTNEAVKVVFAMDDASDISKHTASPEDAFQTITFDNGTSTILGTATIGDMTPAKVTTGLKIQPATGASDLISWTVKPAVGLTFTPTHITGYINRYGTDAEDGIKISAKLGDGSSVALGTFTAVREGKDNSQKFAAKAVYKYDITLTDAQKTALSGGDGFILSSTVGVNTGKQGGFGEVVVEGTVNGTLADVNKYTVGVVAAPAEGGSATIYPKSEDYVEGDEVTLTATENFGYDFVNWTNAAGVEVSTEAKYKATVTADETYTANFVKVNTYELAVAIEGGANDYMISYNPAPTMVEEKMMYEAGTKVTLTASDNVILTFNNWSNGETSKEIEVTMDEAVNLTATYSAIDFIAGWDFYQTGGRTRVADFIGNSENEVATMDMIDASGASKGFYLRPYNNSYEGKTCALNWNALAEKYYFQTMINTNEFSNIKVQSQMLYNYNAWTVQKLEASLDGETWETITSQDLGGVKNWQAVNGTLPAKYEHQPKVYLRWIPDYTSEVKGTSSANDGTCLTNVYIIADKKLVNDGIAPKLVSTVPAEGADNASANGKIVLTFDEKVKVAEGAKADLSGVALTPVASGKTVVVEYKGLKYATAYTFTLPANSVADLTDNYMAEAITINFQTKQKPTIEKGMYDVIVRSGADMKDAIAQANKRADKTKRFRIFVMSGSHKIPVYDSKVTVTVTLADESTAQRTYDEPRTYITADNISIIGADYETTTITNSTPTETYAGKFGNANISEGIGNNDVFQISGKNTYFQGVTVKTGIGDALGRDIAIHDKGDKTIYKDARLWGYQDTYTNNNSNGRFYFEGGVVRGRTDYLCGKGDIWFEGVTLQQCGQGGYPIVPSQPKQYGWIFNSCTLTPETSNVSCTLGRPWGSGTPIALLINTTMEVIPGAEGWSEMSGGYPKRFAEYNSVTKAGTPIDLSSRKKTFGGKENCNNPILTAEEAAQYSISKVMGSTDDWDPTAYTEQASAPANVTISGTSLSWDDSNYVLCWAVIKNGEIVDFTTTPSYTVDDASATWSVRAANEMGGLGEATEATAATGISTLQTEQPALTVGKYIRNNQLIIVRDGKQYNAAGAAIR